MASVGHSMLRFRMTSTKGSCYAHAVMNRRIDLADQAVRERDYHTAFAQTFALTVAGFADSYWYTDTDTQTHMHHTNATDTRSHIHAHTHTQQLAVVEVSHKVEGC